MQNAVKSVMPGNEGDSVSTTPTSGEPPPIYSPMDVEDISPPPYPKAYMGDNNVADAAPTFDPSSAAGPSTMAAVPSTSYGSAKKSRSSGSGRMLNFNIEYRDQNVYFSVPDTEPVCKYNCTCIYMYIQNV